MSRKDDFENQLPPEEHPLFPVEEDGDAIPDVSHISVMRFDGGRLKTATKVFRASELRTIGQLEEMYGGGSYQLWGRRASVSRADEPGTISVKRSFEIPGPSKPLGNYTAEAEAAALRPAVTPGIAPVMNDNVLVAVMQMQQAQTAAMAQAQQQASQQFMTMMAQMMGTSKTESGQMMQMMIQMQNQSQQSMVQLLTAMMANKSGGPEEMAKFLQLAKGLVAPSDSPKEDKEMDVASMLENVADTVAGVNNIMQMRSNGGTAAPPQQVPFVPNKQVGT
jgi:hypothetical protein